MVKDKLKSYWEIFSKGFLDIKFKDTKNSYWIPKEKRKIDYEKMY